MSQPAKDIRAHVEQLLCCERPSCPKQSEAIPRHELHDLVSYSNVKWSLSVLTAVPLAFTEWLIGLAVVSWRHSL